MATIVENGNRKPYNETNIIRQQNYNNKKRL